MEYRYLGRTGLKVSELCMGTMQFGWTADESTAFQILSRAYEAGINFIDTADIYSRWVAGNPGGVAEKIIGRWINHSGIPRDRLVLATKVRGPMGDHPNSEGLSRFHIMQAVEDSLQRLGTDYIDLYQSHWCDEHTPIEETLRTYEDLIRQGKVRYIGASNYPVWRFMESLWASEKLNLPRYNTLQPHYNLVFREEFEHEMANVCRTYGLGVLPYSPLASGFLTGKYQKGSPLPESERASRVSNKYYQELSWTLLDKVTDIALKREKTPSQISLAWLLSNPLITSPIIGARTIGQMEDNLGAIGLRLNEEELIMLA
ncbi:MAG: aldo/keto reductase [Chloroflexota bacterium]